MTAVQPYTPALGDWVVWLELWPPYQVVGVYRNQQDRLVALGVPDSPSQRQAGGGWSHTCVTWLPGWSGPYSWVALHHVRPATPEELAAVQLDRLAAGGL